MKPRIPKDTYAHYQDKGCLFFPSCLSCPYELCLWELPHNQRPRLSAIRHRHILLLRSSGNTHTAIAHILGISRRTVARHLRY